MTKIHAIPTPAQPHDERAIENKLDEITDIHVRLDRKDGEPRIYLWKRDKSFMSPDSVPGMKEWVNSCIAHVEKHHKKVDFQVEFGKRLFRGHRTNSISGLVINLRRIPDDVPELKVLRTPKMWSEILTNKMLDRGGIILIAAETGQGKTSLASAVVRALLLKKSGFALTIEDPPELRLDGEHGDGLCVQTAVSDYEGGTFGAALVSAMRVYPASAVNILYVGEIRDDDTAAEVIKAAVVGQIVISTIHANSIPSAIERLKALAARKMGGEEALSMIASSLRVCIHQQMRWLDGETGWRAGQYTGQIMVSTGDKHAAAHHIRKGELTHLEGDIETQKNKLQNCQNVNDFMAQQDVKDK